MENIFENIDKTGVGTKDDSSILMHKEILRSHKLSLKISSMSPEDEGYKEAFEELLKDKIDDSVMIF